MGYREAIQQIFKVLDYEPTPEQWAIHQDKVRFKQITGGERAGKSMLAEKELVGHWWYDILAQKIKGALIWLLGNDYESCRGEWEYAVADFTKLEILSEPPTKNIDPGMLHLQDGTRIITKSGRYPEKIATEAPYGVVLCEPDQLDYEVFLRARTRLAEKRGWMVMAGTFENRDYVDWYRELYALGQSYNELELKSFSLPTWSNVFIFPGGRQDPEILKQEAGMTPERFMERFGGVPCPKTGRVVTEFANIIHVKPIEFNKNLPVEIAVDPGYRGAAAVLAIQNYGEYLAVIDEVYLQGVITQDLIKIVKKKPWFYAVTGGAIDIEGAAHHSMESPLEVWRDTNPERGAGLNLVYKKITNIEDGIDLLRTHLRQHPITGQPGIIFAPRCQGVIAEMGGGKSPVEGGGIWMRDKNTLKPLDKNDHACSALIYYLANFFGIGGGRLGPFPELRWMGPTAQRTFVRT